MSSIHHKTIKRFGFSGKIDSDSDIARLKEKYEEIILTQMKLSGYVPRVDIDIDFTLEYNHDAAYFQFEISIYGVYLGKKKSKWITGINKTTALYSQQNKLKESSSASE
jgi:hypothetical protein